MAIQIQENDIRLSYMQRVATRQIATECNVDAQNGGVGKLLSVTGGCTVKNSEAADGSVRVTCEVSTKAIYTDGAGAITSADYVSEVNELIAGEEIVAGMVTAVRANIADIQSEISGSSIKVQTVITLEVWGKTDYSTNIVGDVSGAVTRTATVSPTSLRAVASDSFSVTEEYESGTAINKILMFSGDVSFSQVRAGEGSVYVEGEAWMQLVYESEGSISCKQFTRPFAEELMVSSVRADDTVTVTPYVKASSLLITGTAEENVVQAELVIGADIYMYETLQAQIVTDVFSPAAQLSVTTVDKQFSCPLMCKHMTKRICGTVTVDSESGIRRIIAGVLCHSSLTNIYAAQQAIVAEGVMTVGEIYEEEDGNISSAKIEVPFSVSFDASGVTDDCTVEGRVMISDLVSRVKRDSDIEVCAGVQIEAIVYKPCRFTGVTHIEVGEEKELELAGISAYTVGAGETLWDVAKALNMAERDILAQNPDIKEDVREGDRIVVFRSL